jgi:hypothetical protein
MLNVILDHLDVFPSWLRFLLLDASGLWLLLVICAGILKLLQGASVRTAVRAAPGAIKRIGANLEKLLKDPKDYPKIERVLEYGMVVVFYSLSTILFVYFIVLVLLLSMAPKHISLAQQCGVLLYSFVCVFAAAVLKAQAGRCRLNH